MAKNTSKSVVIEDLVKIYPNSKGEVRAVDGVDLTINAGEFVTLLGPSGCGKTTILRMIAGFEVPTTGSILLGAERIDNLTPDKRDTAMVFQSYALFPHLSVFDNVAFGLKLKKMSTADIKVKVHNILELIGLADMQSRAPNQLSGGQQQRVALARALVMEPSVLLFDEPLSNLDAKLRVHMRSEIRRIQQEFGITSIYVTHDQAEAMSMSDRIILMNKGKIEQVGSPHEIYRHPKTSFVADFIGVANILKATVTAINNSLVTINLLGAEFSLNHDKELEQNSTIKVVIRPEALSLADLPSEQAALKAVVKSSVFMGAHQEYILTVDGVDILVVISNPKELEIYKVGDTVGIVFSSENISIV